MKKRITLILMIAISAFSHRNAFNLSANTSEAITQVSLGGSHSAVLNSSGRIFTWGNNANGQLGNGTTGTATNKSAPVEITASFNLNAGETIAQMSLGGNHTLVLSSNDRIFTWGYNLYGQLGDGTLTVKNTPLEITSSFNLIGSETITQVSSGGNHSSAISSNGRVFTWGYNLYGQLGDGSTIDKTTPVEITTGFNLIGSETITQVALGNNHSIAISSTGRIFTWGYNNNGQLGDGTTIDKNTPLNITSTGFNLNLGETITQVSLGDSHSSALSSTGRVFTWGLNSFGRLGDGTTINRSQPVDITSGFVSDSGTITKIELGNQNSSALTSTGRVFTWGLNGLGQLGDGTTTFKETPVEITSGFALADGETIIFVSLGSNHSSAITSTGSIFTWGNNGSGQLGDSTTIGKISPIETTSEFIDYKIAFNSNGGTSVNDIITLKGSNIIAPVNPTRVGYTFAGWFSEEALTNAYVFDKMPASDITLYAKWTINQYTITFESNGGSVVSQIIQNYDTNVVAPVNPTRPGYTFAGWFSEEALTNAYVFDKMPASAITLYAKWTINQYTITFESNGGSVVSQIIQNYDTNVVAPVNPTRPGYTFAGWFSEEALTNAYVFDKMPASAITLYAKWTLVTYTITFELNGGTIDLNQVTSYTVISDSITLLPATLADHVFQGYYLEATFENLVTTINPTEARDLTVYALFFTTNFDIFYRQVNSLPNPLTIEDKALIISYLMTYESLSAFEQGFIDLSILEAALATILTLEVDAVINQITSLSDNITVADEDAVVAARTAYDALTLEQKELVTNYQDLLDAEALITQLIAEINLVIVMIDAFPDLAGITLDDEAEIVAARNAYNALTPEQKELVTNYQDLLDAEARLAQLQQAVIDEVLANEVSAMIAALPDLADITLDDEAEIVAARNAYNALTPTQKALMTNYQDLLDAEAKIAELKSMVSPSDLFSLLPFHLLSGAILLVGFLIKKRKQAQ